MGLADTAGAKQQQVLVLQQQGGLSCQALQFLPVARLEVAMVKTLKALLPGQVRTAQQPLLTRDLAVLQLLLAEGVEELRRAPAFGLSLLCECTPVAAKAGQLELFEQ